MHSIIVTRLVQINCWQVVQHVSRTVCVNRAGWLSNRRLQPVRLLSGVGKYGLTASIAWLFRTIHASWMAAV